MEIIVTTPYKAWIRALEYVYEEGNDFIDMEKRVCREGLNLSLTIEDPSKEPLRPIQILNSFDKWIYPSSNEIRDIVLERQSSPAFSYSYGPRLFNFSNRIDQVDRFIIELLKSDRNSRRAVLSVWSPEEDSKIYQKEIPSIISMQFHIRSGHVHMTEFIRSNDVFFGLPANAYQLLVLLDYVSRKLGLPIGSITIFSTSAHIFHDQFDDIKKVLGSTGNSKIKTFK
jgi:thymidylate synthase